MLTFLFGIRTRWVCMNMLLRLSLMVFCFLFCSCTTVVFVKVLEPQNKDITENVTAKKSAQEDWFGLSGIIIPIMPTWRSCNTFKLRILVQKTEEEKCPVLLLSQGKFYGYADNSDGTTSCSYELLPEEGNIVDGEVTMGVEWNGEIYPLTLSSSRSFAFDFGMIPPK